MYIPDLRDDVVHVTRVRLDGDLVGAEVTLHPEGVDRGSVVHPDLSRGGVNSM